MKIYSTYYIYVLLIPYKRSNSHERSKKSGRKKSLRKMFLSEHPALSKQWHVSVSGMYDDEYSGFRYWYWCRSHGTIRRAREFLARLETANHRNIGCSSYAKNRSAGSRFIPKIENLLERGRLVAHISTVFRLHGNELHASFSLSFSLVFFSFPLFSLHPPVRVSILVRKRLTVECFFLFLSLSVSHPIETWSNFSSNMKIFDENVGIVKKDDRFISYF